MELDIDFEVKRLRVRPGDVIVLKADCKMTPDLAARLREAFEQRTPEGVKVIVLDAGFSLAVLSPELAAELEAAA